jgi:hypothetical protein
MNAITHKQFSQLRNCKTSFNDIYWGFLNTNIAPQRWSDIVSRYNNHKTTHIFHIVTYLYKIYIKSSFNKSTIKPLLTIKPVVIESKPLLTIKPVVIESKPVVVVGIEVIKEKFTGAYRHTALSNYKEWAKSQRSFNTNYKINSATFSEWQRHDKFNKKFYNTTHPWFHYIDNHMI